MTKKKTIELLITQYLLLYLNKFLGIEEQNDTFT